VIDHAAALPDGRVVAFTAGEVLLYLPERGVIDRWTMPLPIVRAAAAITADQVVLLDDQGTAQVLTISDRTVTPLPIEIEPGRPSTTAPRFTSVTAGPGFGWLSGGADLARVRAGPAGLRGELWWGPRIREQLATGADPLEVELYTAAAVLCSGSTVVQVRATVVDLIGAVFYLSRTVLLEPKDERGEFGARPLAGFVDQLRLGSRSFRHLASHLGASPVPVMTFRHGLVLRPDSNPWYLPHPDVTALVERSTNAVITDRVGNRVFLRVP
jgi:hypothetical protein